MTADTVLAGAGVVPVLRLGSADAAVTAGRRLIGAGYRVLEVALTTPGGLDAVAELSAAGAVVGAGTVLTRDGLRDAAAAGAAFAVSPAVLPELVPGAPIEMILGAATPTEVHAAMCAGCRVVKIFPARHLGGPGYLRTLRGPFPGLRAFPSGGIDPADAAAYLDAGAVAVGVGSALAGGGDPPAPSPAAAV